MRGKPVLFADFSGGINAQGAPYLLSPKECRDARNMVPAARGAIRKRDGNVTFATVPAALHSLFAVDSSKLLGVGGTKIYTVTAGGTAAALTPTVTADVPWQWVHATPSGGQGPVYGVNGVDTPKYFDGTSAGSWTAATGTLPNGRFITYADNRIFVARTAANPSRLQWSDLSATGPAPRDWPAVNFADFDPDDGEEITGLGRVGPYLLVFKPHKAWVVFDTDTGASRRLGSGVGCVAHRSIVETTSGTYFLSRDQGVMVTDGSTVQRASDNVKPLLDRIPIAKQSQAAGAFYDRHYYLAVSVSSAGNDYVLDLDLVGGAWWAHTNHVSEWAAWEPGGLSIGLFAARQDAARVERCYVPSVTTDNDVPFTAYWKSAFFSFGSPYKRKRVRQIHFDGVGRAQIGVAKSFQTADTLVGDVPFPSSGGSFGVEDGSMFGVEDGTFFGDFASIAEARVFTPGVARAWSVVFRNQSVDPLEVESFTFALTDRTN